MTEVSWALALGAGVLSFFTPCILPILPAYISFITGTAVKEILDNRPPRGEILPPIVLFCLGFSVVFVILGATVTALGRLLSAHQRTLQLLGGIVVILLGLQQMGLLKLGFLQRDRRVHLKAKPAHKFGALVVGVAFAAGWTPCLGPVLGSILAYASTKETVIQGVTLLSLFSLGMSVPFVALGLALGVVLPRIRAASRFMRWIGLANGALLILLGLLLMTDQMSFLLRMVS